MNQADGLMRLLSVAFRRYSRDPESRAYSARHLLATSIALCCEHMSVAEVSLYTAENLAELARQHRQEERSVG